MAMLGADEERRLIADGRELARRLRAEADEIDRLIQTIGQGAPSSRELHLSERSGGLVGP
jgi:hypothetical protein